MPIYGREDLRSQIASLRHAFPDLSIELDDLLICGDRAAYRYAAAPPIAGSSDISPRRVAG
jgi:hypothetical protein